MRTAILNSELLAKVPTCLALRRRPSHRPPGLSLMFAIGPNG